ncbi:MAG: hypothetical protein JKY92_09755 [Magnetovibrio sp.]|nr:hypothetical protein [Magnetovibrio sp.]
MKSFVKPIAFALILGTTFIISSQSFAQSTQAMKYLSPEERKSFNARLQTSGGSASRSKVTAEMNLVIQQRRMEQRRLEREKKALKGQK